MTERHVTVCNELGMHLRSAGAFVRLAAKFQSQVRVGTAELPAVDGKSILGLATLGAPRGTVLHLSADGPDEQEAIEALAALVNDGFEE
jgi:phosphotransferase system HPr (HPr) family protein